MDFNVFYDDFIGEVVDNFVDSIGFLFKHDTDLVVSGCFIIFDGNSNCKYKISQEKAAEGYSLKRGLENKQRDLSELLFHLLIVFVGKIKLGSDGLGALRAGSIQAIFSNIIPTLEREFEAKKAHIVKIISNEFTIRRFRIEDIILKDLVEDFVFDLKHRQITVSQPDIVWSGIKPGKNELVQLMDQSSRVLIKKIVNLYLTDIERPLRFLFGAKNGEYKSYRVGTVVMWIITVVIILILIKTFYKNSKDLWLGILGLIKQIKNKYKPKTQKIMSQNIPKEDKKKK